MSHNFELKARVQYDGGYIKEKKDRKSCLIDKLNNLLQALEKNHDLFSNLLPEIKIPVLADDYIKLITDIIKKLDNINNQSIHLCSNFCHVMGQLNSFLAAFNVFQTATNDFRAEKKEKNLKILMNALSDIWKYLDLCRRQDHFFEQELFNEQGFFSEKQDNGLLVHEKNVSDYIAYCLNHFHPADQN